MAAASRHLLTVRWKILEFQLDKIFMITHTPRSSKKLNKQTNKHDLVAKSATLCENFNLVLKPKTSDPLATQL